MITIKTAGTFDFAELYSNDKHISREMLDKKITDGEILIAELDGVFLGFLRFSFFWREQQRDSAILTRVFILP